MCGIIAVLRRRRRRQSPSRDQIEALLTRAAQAVSDLGGDGVVTKIDEAAETLQDVTQRWPNADSASPEIVNLKTLSVAV